jgi:hypothetical protein
MPNVIEARRELVQELRERPIVDEVDFSRDGYQTVLLRLGEPIHECQRCGDDYTEDAHAYTDEYDLCKGCFNDLHEKTHTARMDRVGRFR